jgi:hypothetical protein
MAHLNFLLLVLFRRSILSVFSREMKIELEKICERQPSMLEVSVYHEDIAIEYIWSGFTGIECQFTLVPAVKLPNNIRNAFYYASREIAAYSFYRAWDRLTWCMEYSHLVTTHTMEDEIYNDSGVY